MRRDKRGGFFRVERVDAKVLKDVGFAIEQSNYDVLLSVFKVILNSRIHDVLATIFREQIQIYIDSFDSILLEIGSCAEVFTDAGPSRGPALAAASGADSDICRGRVALGCSADGRRRVRIAL